MPPNRMRLRVSGNHHGFSDHVGTQCEPMRSPLAIVQCAKRNDARTRPTVGVESCPKQPTPLASPNEQRRGRQGSGYDSCADSLPYCYRQSERTFGHPNIKSQVDARRNGLFSTMQRVRVLLQPRPESLPPGHFCPQQRRWYPSLDQPLAAHVLTAALNVG